MRAGVYAPNSGLSREIAGALGRCGVDAERVAGLDALLAGGRDILVIAPESGTRLMSFLDEKAAGPAAITPVILVGATVPEADWTVAAQLPLPLDPSALARAIAHIRESPDNLA